MPPIFLWPLSLQRWLNWRSYFSHSYSLSIILTRNNRNDWLALFLNKSAYVWRLELHLGNHINVGVVLEEVEGALDVTVLGGQMKRRQTILELEIRIDSILQRITKPMLCFIKFLSKWNSCRNETWITPVLWIQAFVMINNKSSSFEK